MIAYNSEIKEFELVFAASLNKEDKDIFIQLYEFLKFKYNFNPALITCDFSMIDKSVINRVFDKILIITCFFHLIQSTRRNASIFKIRKKYSKQNTHIIFQSKAFTFHRRKFSNFLL